MSDHPADLIPSVLHNRADAYRTPAETSESPRRKAAWLARAKHWDELTLKAAERLLDSVKSG
jgi:hypothetical protein